MRKLIGLLALVVVLASCGDKKMTVTDFLAEAPQMLDKTVTVEGTIDRVSSCGKMMLNGEAEEMLYVEIKDSTFKPCETMVGKTACIEGVVKSKEVKVEELDADIEKMHAMIAELEKPCDHDTATAEDHECCQGKDGEAKDHECCQDKKDGEVKDHECCQDKKDGEVKDHECCQDKKDGEVKDHECQGKNHENAKGEHHHQGGEHAHHGEGQCKETRIAQIKKHIAQLEGYKEEAKEGVFTHYYIEATKVTVKEAEEAPESDENAKEAKEDHADCDHAKKHEPKAECDKEEAPEAAKVEETTTEE